VIATAVPASRVAGDLVAWAEARLSAVSDAARLEAEVLLADSTGLNRAAVMAHPELALDSAQAARLAAFVARRSRGEPLAYIVGRREFYSLPLAVTAAVLVPRPETELLVEAALQQHPAMTARVLDLGTGSGAIALALKSERPEWEVTAIDCSLAALEIARLNAMRLGLEVCWLQSDWFAAIADLSFDLIVSNPPYVPSRDPHFAAALGHEPRIALDGGADGLEAYRSILSEAAAYLAPQGKILFEHGYDQRAALIELAAMHSWSAVAALDDLAGQPRVAVFNRAADG
jgi:release factor glutamine methyltransferase